MDFANEAYVRLYVRDSTNWKRMNWQAKALLPLLLRKVDRAGILPLEGGDPTAVAALHSELPIEVVAEGLPKLLELGTVVAGELGLLFPKFIDAQEASKTDKQRQRECRERRRDKARKPVTKRDQDDVAASEVSRGHATGHDVTEPVTLCLTSAEPCNALQAPAVPAGSEPAAEAPKKPDPAAFAKRLTFAQIGSDRLKAADKRLKYYVGKGQDAELEEIGSAPEDEWAVVAAVLKSEMAKGNARYLTPRGITNNWRIYASGQAPGGPATSKAKSAGPAYSEAAAPDPNYQRTERIPLADRLMKMSPVAAVAGGMR